MRTVWKYALDVADGTVHHHDIPSGGVVRHVGVQPVRRFDAATEVVTEYDQLVMWVEVDPGAPKVRREFRVVGTGAVEVGDGFVYAGTAQAGGFVWHVYESTSADVPAGGFDVAELSLEKLGLLMDGARSVVRGLS